jgi:hypothetical protein
VALQSVQRCAAGCATITRIFQEKPAELRGILCELAAKCRAVILKPAAVPAPATARGRASSASERHTVHQKKASIQTNLKCPSQDNTSTNKSRYMLIDEMWAAMEL